MLSQTMQNALNDQIKLELAASHAYLAMAAYCDAANLPGCATWFRMQSEEEREHALKIYDYVNDRGSRVLLQALDAPQTEFESLLNVFETSLEHERKVTNAINRLYAQALQEADYPTQVMLQWFINEQVEEEKTIGQVIEQIKLVGAQGSALFLLDRQLGAREED